MPLSDIRARVLRTLAANRSPESCLAGGAVLHRGARTPRYSRDLDFFHDVADSVAHSAEQDAATLRAAGYKLEWHLRTGAFRRAVVTGRGYVLKIEWAQDSAVRFFPVREDEVCGYRLHGADAAVNTLLALAGRDEVRDFVDALYQHEPLLAAAVQTGGTARRSARWRRSRVARARGPACRPAWRREFFV